MPKEIAHICLARTLFNELDKSSLFHAPVKAHMDLFLYGAIAPDTFYYYLFGPQSAFIQAFSHKFHTDKRSCLDPVLELLTGFKTRNTAELAFAAGIVCHIITDTVFHPLVYYYSGMNRLHPGAENRHRAFETALDVYFLTRIKKTPLNDQAFSFSSLSRQQVFDCFDALFTRSKRISRPFLSLALNCHETAFRLFKNRLARFLVNRLHQIGLGLPANYHALFYPENRQIELSFFNHTMYYRDPVSGSAQTESIKTLCRKTIDHAIQLLSVLENGLHSNQDLSCCLDHPDIPEIKPNLNERNFNFWYGHNNLVQMIYKH